MAEPDNPTALAKGFFWMGEQWRYGYEGVEPNPAEAFIPVTSVLCANAALGI
jgi:hypothetical protein